MTDAVNIYYESYKQLIKKPRTLDRSEQELNQQLDLFLREHQKQAYTISLVSVHQESDALDVVQDAMMSFVKSYKHKPQDSWKPLFYRILQNKINDFHRKQSSWLRNFFNNNDKENLAEQQQCQKPSPLDNLATQQQGNEMIGIIKSLPEKQKQVVIYRHWQQMSVEETAQIMNVSTGSVKTHLFRASQKIKEALGTQYE